MYIYIIYIHIHICLYIHVYIYFLTVITINQQIFCFVRSNFAIPCHHSFLKCFLCSALMCWSNVFRLFATTKHRTAITVHVLLKQVVPPLHLLSFVFTFSTHAASLFAFLLMHMHSSNNIPTCLRPTLKHYILAVGLWPGPDCWWTSASSLHIFSPFL